MKEEYTIIKKNGEQIMFMWNPTCNIKAIHVNTIFAYNLSSQYPSKIEDILVYFLLPAVTHYKGEVIRL